MTAGSVSSIKAMLVPVCTVILNNLLRIFFQHRDKEDQKLHIIKKV